MVRVLAFALFFLSLVAPVSAQAAPPDYAIRYIRSSFSDDNRQAIVAFEVHNLGGSTTVSATATLRVIATGQEIAAATILPIPAGQKVDVSLPFSTAQFTPGSVESMRVAVGVDEVEMAGSQTIQNNFAQISISFPQNLPETTPEPAPTPTPASSNPISDLLNSAGIQLDLNNPVHVAALAGMCGAALILALIVLIILRLLFQRTPDFGNWQPPYAAMLPLDPNSLAGRRQQWQQHAQNSLLPPACVDGNTHILKRLVGLEGAPLSGWRITALRINQYDMYGRINRSQVLAPGSVLKRLNGTLRRNQSLNQEQMVRRLRPAARALVNKLRRRLNDRNVMLPIALDVRLQGKHGDVRILFELFQCRFGTWQILDQWEPEMTIAGKIIQESYTFTFYGQRPGETMKSFSQRLQDDLAHLLAGIMVIESAAPAHDIVTPTNPHQDVVETPPEQPL